MAFHKGRLKRKPNLVPSVMVLVNLVLVVSALGYAHVMIVVFGNPFEGEIVVRWDFGWHNQKGGWVDVIEAIKLRDEGTLKTGDLFCCPQCVRKEDGVRLHPVDSVARAKHLRRDPTYNEDTVRSSCTKQTDSRKKGETWKHTRVLNAIEYMFDHENLLSDIGFSRFKRLDGAREWDFDLFDENNNNSKLIVVLKNLNRARSIKRQNPNAHILHIHRWREADVDFVEYIKNMLIQIFNDDSKNDEFCEYVKKTFAIPCIGLRPEQSKTNPLVGRGMVVKITSEMEEDSFEADQLQMIEHLVERVQEHNMWAISTLGEHRFDTKHLSFEEFTGVGKHPDPAVDAILSALSDGSNHPGVAFHQFPDQVKLRRDAIQNEELVDNYAASVIQELKEEGIEIPDENSLREHVINEFIQNTNSQAEEIERIQSESENVRKDALDWVVSNSEKKLLKLLKDGKLRVDAENEIEFYVEGEWYLWTQKEQNPCAYERQRQAAVVDAPQLLAPWENLSEDGRKKCLKGLKKRYREYVYVAGFPYILTPLVDIKLGQKPKVLTDPYGLVNRIVEVSPKDEFEFTPLLTEELNSLCFYLSADKLIDKQESKHPSFLDLMWAAKNGTEHLQRVVELQLPQPIEKLLEGKVNVSIEILDLLAQSLESRDDTNT